VHTDKFRGLLRFSPFQAAQITNPVCLFIFCDDGRDKDIANELYFILRKGLGSFPGIEQFTGVSISRDRLDALRLDPALFHSDRDYSGIYDAVSNHLAASRHRPDIAYVIADEAWKYRRPSPYGAIKAAMVPYSLPSQFVSRQLIRSRTQFQFAIPNIALASFTKLGGVPWRIRRLDSPQAMVIGVGTTTVSDATSDRRKRILGYSICMLSDGLFVDMKFFGAAASHEEFLPQLTAGLRRSLSDHIQKSDISKLTLHVSHFERRDTVRAIESVLDESRKEFQTALPFELLRLTYDSQFMIFDLDHPGYVPSEGIAIGLSPRHALVVTEGRQETAKWRGRKPVTLEIHREYSSIPTLPLLDSLNDVFQLGFVNWRTFHEKTEPVSLAYAKMLSQRIADMAAVRPSILDDLSQNADFGRRLWFL
jgi:hypothetical protein